MPGLQVDTLDKIVKVYFAGVIAKAFRYENETFHPKKIVVSPLIFRGTTCPMTCGGCCFKFSLVWIPGEPKDYGPDVIRQTVSVNGVDRELFVDLQEGNSDHFCQHLIKKNGLCGIYRNRPFSCDFELIRFIHQRDHVDIATRLFGRGWSYTRVTGQTGAMCDVLPASPKHRDDAARKLKRLKEWTDYFELETYLDRIIAWVESGPHDEPLVIDPRIRPIAEFVAGLRSH